MKEMEMHRLMQLMYLENFVFNLKLINWKLEKVWKCLKFDRIHKSALSTYHAKLEGAVS